MIFSTTNKDGKLLDLIKRDLNAVIIRHNVISDNIANADTPGFRRAEVSFESQLKRALESERKTEYPARMTHTKHIPFEEKIDYRTVRPRISIDYDTFYRNDKNGVDIDKEMVDFTKNAMRYNLLIEMYNRNARKIELVMRSTV
ncbi:MAG: flagellar basal body rod protein FlgB [Spirochaetia bacterium]|nr:flagellar basal body rod protein FlgB [Spirochaetota bacterium]MCX8096901.1 flagellar basal body rod protein FlgB [Spirochaetota bacterium]MDW8112458.1 flagellar basal body rod protein FlgB [Spirochaetia bacterium]